MTDIDQIVERARDWDVDHCQFVSDADYPEFDHELSFEFFHDAAGDYCLCIPGSRKKDTERSRKLYEAVCDLFEQRVRHGAPDSINASVLDTINLAKIGKHLYENLLANGVYWDHETGLRKRAVDASGGAK